MADALNRKVGHAGQDRGQVFANGQFQPAAAFDYRQNGGHLRPCLLAADMDPVLAFMYTCS